MKSKSKVIVIFFAICIVISLAISIGITKFGAKGNMKIMSVENNTFNGMNGSYKYFNGAETRKIKLKKGDILNIDFSSEVSKGKLYISILDEKGEVIKTLESNTEGNETIKANNDKTITIRIQGEKTKGSYDISWDK